MSKNAKVLQEIRNQIGKERWLKAMEASCAAGRPPVEGLTPMLERLGDIGKEHGIHTQTGKYVKDILLAMGYHQGGSKACKGSIFKTGTMFLK